MVLTAIYSIRSERIMVSITGNVRHASWLVIARVAPLCDAYLNPSAAAIQQLAAKLQISSAIVAGRLRFERQDYSLFTKLVGLRQARIGIPEIRWS
jgi:hypothetical protein